MNEMLHTQKNEENQLALIRKELYKKDKIIAKLVEAKK
jgi:hypothetical protein